MFLLVDADQGGQALGLEQAFVDERAEQLLGVIEQTGLLIVMSQLQTCAVCEFSSQPLLRQNVLMQPQSAVHLAPPAEQAAQGKVQVRGLVRDLYGLDQGGHRSVGVIGTCGIEAGEVIGGLIDSRAGRALLNMSARDGPAQREPDGQQQDHQTEAFKHGC